MLTMLRHLRVTNFAILSDVTLEFGEGFNVLTGETGAGKSLIVEAVNLLRGGRASADIPRAGEDQATVEAVFDVPSDLSLRVAAVLEDAGLPDTDGELCIRRIIYRAKRPGDSRSRTYVNGALTTAKRLAELGSLLVDLSGQHQHQGLVDSARHRQILDAFGVTENTLETMRSEWLKLEQLTSLKGELGDNQAREERIDFLRYQLKELREARVRPGEDEELTERRTQLRSADQLEAGSRSAESLLYGADAAAIDILNSALRELDRLVPIDERLREPHAQIEEAKVLCEDAARSLGTYADSIDSDPGQLAEVEDRLAVLHRLSRKHGGSLTEVVTRQETLETELADLEQIGDSLTNLDNKISAQEAIALSAAHELSKLRGRACRKLARAVKNSLVELGMTASELIIDRTDKPLSVHGTDSVEFLLQANRGEEPKALARVASGGELSRIMLALKLVLRRADAVGAYVFDEVDAGIGGGAAEIVGRCIRDLSTQRQVLCVTHLPQIAAFADRHFSVAKAESAGRTETTVRQLSRRERTEETARMLAGATVTKQARAHANEMLRAAR